MNQVKCILISNNARSTTCRRTFHEKTWSRAPASGSGGPGLNSRGRVIPNTFQKSEIAFLIAAQELMASITTYLGFHKLMTGRVVSFVASKGHEEVLKQRCWAFMPPSWFPTLSASCHLDESNLSFLLPIVYVAIYCSFHVSLSKAFWR